MEKKPITIIFFVSLMQEILLRVFNTFPNDIFGLFETERVCRQQFFFFMLQAEGSLNGKKTVWKKEKLLIMSNFSFSQNVFKRLILQTHKNKGFFGKGLKLKTQRVDLFRLI